MARVAFASLGGLFLLSALLSVVGCPSVLDAKVLPSQAKEDHITAGTEHVSRTWTFMLYLAGDSGDITPSLRQAIERMERVSPRPNLNVLVLFDGWDEGDTRLYRIQHHPDSGMGSPSVSYPWPTWDGASELNTGGGDTLERFVSWARANLSALVVE